MNEIIVITLIRRRKKFSFCVIGYFFSPYKFIEIFRDLLKFPYLQVWKRQVTLPWMLTGSFQNFSEDVEKYSPRDVP